MSQSAEGSQHVCTPEAEILSIVAERVKDAQLQNPSEPWSDALVAETLTAAAWLHREQYLEYCAVTSGRF